LPPCQYLRRVDSWLLDTASHGHVVLSGFTGRLQLIHYRRRGGARHLIWMPAFSFTLAPPILPEMPAGSGLYVS
jgi:hypothetical protein